MKVPVTVSLADLTADSISNEPTRLLEPTSEPFVAAYEFQSASSDEEEDDSVFGSELRLLSPLLSPAPAENQFCIFQFRIQTVVLDLNLGSELKTSSSKDTGDVVGSVLRLLVSCVQVDSSSSVNRILWGKIALGRSSSHSTVASFVRKISSSLC